MISKNAITRRSAPTLIVEIYIGGPIDRCKEILAARAADIGACWSVEPTEFIYTGGRETGSIVRSINYPRFPSDPPDLMARAVELGEHLIRELHQSSCSVVGPFETVWLSRRGGEE